MSAAFVSLGCRFLIFSYSHYATALYDRCLCRCKHGKTLLGRTGISANPLCLRQRRSTIGQDFCRRAYGSTHSAHRSARLSPATASPAAAEFFGRGDVPRLLGVVAAQQLGHLLGTQPITQRDEEERPASVDDGAVFFGGVVASRQTNGLLFSARRGPHGRSWKPVDEALASRVTICALKITVGGILRQCFIQPRMVHLVVADDVIPPLVCHLMHRG